MSDDEISYRQLIPVLDFNSRRELRKIMKNNTTIIIFYIHIIIIDRFSKDYTNKLKIILHILDRLSYYSLQDLSCEQRQFIKDVLYRSVPLWAELRQDVITAVDLL